MALKGASLTAGTLKEQGIERRPEVHLGFEAAGRLDDAQRHDIMQKRSEPDYSRHLEQARTVGHDIREWLDTPVKQHELVRRLQHDVAREHGFDMRDRVSRSEPNAPERVKSPSRGFLWDSEHGPAQKKITHAPVIGGASAT